MKDATDFLIECHDPKIFDKTIQMIGAAVLAQDSDGRYIKREGYYVMRVFQNADYLKFAIMNQGYGTVIRELDELI